MKILFPGKTGASALLATGLAIASAMMAAPSAQAFVITSQLTGDPRVRNPDGLVVDVTIKSGQDGIAGNQALWTVDLNSPAHSNIKLGGFFFNLADSIKGAVSFSGFDPTGWAIVSSNGNAEGSGGADFQFELIDSKDIQGKPDDITNSRSLSFLMSYAGGVLQAADFLNAPSSSSGDLVLGSGQLGAHLQSLTVNSTTCSQGECSDSGFAMGNYESEQTSVPEPGTVAALGVFAVGSLGLLRKKAKQVQA